MDLNSLANPSTIFFTPHSAVNQKSKSLSLQQEALPLLAKRKQVTEIPSDSEPEENNLDSDSETELQIAGAAAQNDDTAIAPLTCKPQELWHLRYGHASTTVLRKL